jgi:hypothetical protein
VEPRYGRLYASAVLRPLAEQVIDALGVQRGEIACDLMCDGATLGVALGAAVGRQGRVVLVDSDAPLLQLAAEDVSATGCSVSTLEATGVVEAPDQATADRVASLCTYGFWDGDSLLDVAEGVSRRRATVLTWDAAEPPAHEIALTDALRDIARIDSPFLRRCLDCPDANRASPWEPVILRDVVQFDGIAAYWAAMVLERPLRREFDKLPGDEVAAVRSACQRALQRWTAADGTMRIPVRATLWCLRPA